MGLGSYVTVDALRSSSLGDLGNTVRMLPEPQTSDRPSLLDLSYFSEMSYEEARQAMEEAFLEGIISIEEGKSIRNKLFIKRYGIVGGIGVAALITGLIFMLKKKRKK